MRAVNKGAENENKFNFNYFVFLALNCCIVATYNTYVRARKYGNA